MPGKEMIIVSEKFHPDAVRKAFADCGNIKYKVGGCPVQALCNEVKRLTRELETTKISLERHKYDLHEARREGANSMDMWKERAKKCKVAEADRDRLRDMLIPRLRDEARVNLLVEQNELNYKLMKGGMTVEEYDAKNVELEQSYRAALDAPGVNGDERIYKGAISDQGSDGRRPGQSIE